MHVEIDFGAPATLDMLTIEAGMGETAALRIEALDQRGGWVALSEKAQPAPGSVLAQQRLEYIALAQVLPELVLALA